MYCVKCFPWLMESAEGIFLLSSFTVALPAPHTDALVTNLTTCHTQLKRNKAFDDAMCTMLCLGAREIELSLYTVKTTVLKKS